MTRLLMGLVAGLLLLGAAVAAFFWAVGSGQFDDLESPGMSVIMDDDSKPKSE
jgi:cbb3-type cytochrome oxidase maturation protein